MSTLDWTDLFTEPEPEPVMQMPKPAVETWTKHGFDCVTAHKTNATFMKCALRKKHNGDRWSVSSTEIFGSGDWAILDKWFTSTFGEHNGRRMNNSYYTFRVHLYETYEEAVEGLVRLKRIHTPGPCSGSCVGHHHAVIKVNRT